MDKKAKIKYQGKKLEVIIDENNNIISSDNKIIDENQVIWLPPSEGIMFALGLNYADHANELDFKPPTKPLIFLKTPSTYTGHKQFSWRPEDVDYMHYECELVAVIGKTGKNISKEKSLDYVVGYTLCNDYAIRDYLENYYRPNLRVKNRYKTTPVGPYIINAKDVPNPMNLILKTWVNGELKQEGTTNDMIFDIPFLIEYLSSFMTLNPGDMIATGTPKGTSDVKAGDRVDIEIEGIGKLTNYILSEKDFVKNIKVIDHD